MGGAASGKSDHAQTLAEKLHNGNGHSLIYLATMSAKDTESLERIDKHRQMRYGRGYETVELPYDISRLCEMNYSERSVVLIEDLSNLLAGHAFVKESEMSCSMRQHADNIIRDIKQLDDKYADVVVVSNDIAGDVLTVYEDMTREYIEALQYINCELARYAGEVQEVCCSRVIKHAFMPDRIIEDNNHKGGKMTFVTGGAYSGKTEYVKQHYINKYYVNSLRALKSVAQDAMTGVSDSVSQDEVTEVPGNIAWEVNEGLRCENIIVDQLENIVFEAMQSGEDVLTFFEKVADKYQNTESVFVCSENGCGVVPVTKTDREFRELCGRVACIFAKRAGSVVRMYCGIPEPF